MDSAAAPICTICLEPVVENNGRSTARLQCNHVFHLDCIGSEFNVRRVMQCPNCRETEAGQWLFAGGEFGENIEDEGVELIAEFVNSEQPHLLSWMRNWVSDLPSPYGEMSMMPIHNASVSYQHVPVPTFHQLHQNRWNAQVPHAPVGNGAVNAATQSLFASQPARVLMSVHGAGLASVVPPLLSHEYQVLREVPSLPYESTATPSVPQMTVSSHQSHQPPLARVPAYVPIRASNYRGAMNHVTQMQPPSSLVGSYAMAPFSGFMVDNGSSGLQFPPHSFGGPS